MNVAVLLSPGASFSFANPLSCFGGLDGAEEGKVMYSWGASAPCTPPVFLTTAVTVATVSQRSARPPGMVSPEAGPEEAVEVMEREE